ncbi:MAG: hypothetical protein D3910_07155 [Candidatus Electrothrix sp. ATG2]|nr:hypothetical protein [Candidatus Electrothrix sp. ATG2]
MDRRAGDRGEIIFQIKAIEGLQSLDYRVETEQEDIRAIGSGERIGVSFGLRTVRGELAIRSADHRLDGLLERQGEFQLVVNLKQDEFSESPKRTLAFDGCYVEDKKSGMGAGGTVLTTYVFSATRLREE